MGILIEYVAIYAPWIYAVCGLVALYQIYRLWNVRAERRQAVFSLEREKALRELQSIFSVAMFLLMAMGATYFISTTLAAAVEPLVSEARNPNPTAATIPTPTNTPLPATETPTITPTNLITVTLPVQPTPNLTLPTNTPAFAPVVQGSSCGDGRSVITSPGNNQTLSGVVTVLGTATHDRFQYFKVEYAPAGSQGFNYLDGGSSPVVNGALVTFDTTTLANGAWTLRLVVVDATGNFPDPCQVTMQIQN
jgi:hypothetical protein